MSFFSNYTDVLYDFTVNTDSDQIRDIVTDLTTRVSSRFSPYELAALTQDYVIESFETPEIISDKLYGDVNFHWSILWINEITDYYSQWPLNETAMAEFCQQKYGVNINERKYSVKLPEMIIMDRSYILSEYGSDYLLDISNWDYENMINDNKRIIKVIYPQYINQFTDKFMEQLKL